MQWALWIFSPEVRRPERVDNLPLPADADFQTGGTMYIFTWINFLTFFAHCLGPSDQYLLSPLNVYIWLLKVSLRRDSAHVESRNILQERGEASLMYMVRRHTDLL